MALSSLLSFGIPAVNFVINTAHIGQNPITKTIPKTQSSQLSFLLYFANVLHNFVHLKLVKSILK